MVSAKGKGFLNGLRKLKIWCINDIDWFHELSELLIFYKVAAFVKGIYKTLGNEVINCQLNVN